MGYLALILWSVSGIIHWAGLLAALRYLRRDRKSWLSLSQNYEPVTVLKPLCGVDEGLSDNLESFFRINYPQFELLFCVAEIGDPACEVVRRLMERYPKVNAKLKAGEVHIGPNPKVNNLYLPYHSASYDLILISDSNVRIDPSYLKVLTSYLEKGVGLVTSALSGAGQSGLGAWMESNYLDAMLMRWIHFSRLLRRPLIMGKSMLFRRSDFAKVGGIEALRCFIAEDYAAGGMLRSLGLKVRVAHQPVKQYLGRFSLKQYWARHLRWGRIRKSCEPWAFVLEPVVGGTLTGLIGAYGFHSVFGISFAAVFLSHLVMVAVLDLYLIARVQGRWHWMSAVGWWVAEVLTLPIWLHVSVGNKILWRGHPLKLKRGGLLEDDGMGMASLESLKKASSS